MNIYIYIYINEIEINFSIYKKKFLSKDETTHHTVHGLPYGPSTEILVLRKDMTFNI